MTDLHQFMTEEARTWGVAFVIIAVLVAFVIGMGNDEIDQTNIILSKEEQTTQP